MLIDMNTTTLLTERYAEHIRGTISCFDRVIVSGTLVDCCHRHAMQSELVRRQIPFFDYAKQLADPLRNRLHDNAKAIAAKEGVQIEYIQKIGAFRKEDRIREILRKRGDHPGLVHIFAAPESCMCFKPWHDRTTQRTGLKNSTGRCTHYYFYFIDALFGLCYLRVPTWAPFTLQFYCNLHNWLAIQMRLAGIVFEQQDNAFVRISDFAAAQALADAFDPNLLHRRLETWGRRYCPVLDEFTSGWHWSLCQLEYATDIIFERPDGLKPLYEHLTHTAIHAVKADDIATFLGRNGLSPLSDEEGGSRYNVLVEGTRIRHNLGKTSIKMYDKFGHVLRVETTTSDVGFFKHYRRVEHRDGSSQMKFAPVKKTIHSLGALRELLAASNRRYVEFISTFTDTSPGQKALDHVSRTVRDAQDRPNRGINFFRTDDQALVLAVLRGENTISGFTARRLRRVLHNWKPAHISRALRRLRAHGMIRKIGGTFKYYITAVGRRVFIATQRLRETVLIPALAHG